MDYQDGGDEVNRRNDEAMVENLLLSILRDTHDDDAPSYLVNSDWCRICSASSAKSADISAGKNVRRRGDF